jgi:hypothetical protein
MRKDKQVNTFYKLCQQVTIIKERKVKTVKPNKLAGYIFQCVDQMLTKMRIYGRKLESTDFGDYETTAYTLNKKHFLKNQEIYVQSLYGKSMRMFEKKAEKLIN